MARGKRSRPDDFSASVWFWVAAAGRWQLFVSLLQSQSDAMLVATALSERFSEHTAVQWSGSQLAEVYAAGDAIPDPPSDHAPVMLLARPPRLVE